MNLHDLSLRGSRWLWVTVSGGNGRRWGTHAYEIERTPVPERTEGWDVPPAWANRTWWTPPRFNWRPYSGLNNIFRNRGFYAPLCGQTSRARFPSADDPWNRYDRCYRCERVARERGIMISTRTDAEMEDPTLSEITREHNEWRRARTR